MEKFSRLGEQSTASPWLCFFFFLLLLLCTKRLYYYYFGQNLVIDHCSHMMESVPAAAESPTTWRHSVIWFVSGCNLLRPTLKRKCVYLRITGDIFGSKAKKKKHYAPSQSKKDCIYFPNSSHLTVIVHSMLQLSCEHTICFCNIVWNSMENPAISGFCN